MGKTAFAKLQPSCQWFITVSPGRSGTDSGMDICGSNEWERYPSPSRLGSPRECLKLDHLSVGAQPRPKAILVFSFFGAVDKTSSSFSAHGKIGNFIISSSPLVADLIRSQSDFLN